jgi:hypothetical protein
VSSDYGGLGFLDFSIPSTGIIRGGDFDDAEKSGVFSADSNNPYNYASSGVGFRCVYVP